MAKDKKDFWELWRIFGKQLKTCIIQPVRYPSFIFYFIVIIIMAGGLGAWLLIFQIIPSESELDIPRALTTYAVAILAASLVSIILSKKDEHALLLFALFICVICGFLSLGTFTASKSQDAQIYGIIVTVLSLFLWWVANAENPDLTGLNPNVATGGDPKSQKLSGDLSGLQT